MRTGAMQSGPPALGPVLALRLGADRIQICVCVCYGGSDTDWMAADGAGGTREQMEVCSNMGSTVFSKFDESQPSSTNVLSTRPYIWPHFGPTLALVWQRSAKFCRMCLAVVRKSLQSVVAQASRVSRRLRRSPGNPSQSTARVVGPSGQACPSSVGWSKAPWFYAAQSRRLAAQAWCSKGRRVGDVVSNTQR